MLDLMHDGEPYGHLTAGGVPITEEQLARMVGEPLKAVRAALQMLEDRGIFSRSPAHLQSKSCASFKEGIYSRRMVRDEEIRQRRAACGAESSKNPNVPRAKGVPKDIPEDVLQGRPSKTSLGGSFDPSPSLSSSSSYKRASPSTVAKSESETEHSALRLTLVDETELDAATSSPLTPTPSPPLEAADSETKVDNQNVGRFLKRFVELYAEHLHGAKYLVKKARDIPLSNNCSAVTA